VGRGEFDAFYRSERPGLVRLAHLLGGSVAVAEELAQEALWSVQQRWESLDNPSAYARTALANQVKSLHRRRARERRSAVRAAAEPLTHEPELDNTWDAIRRLPERQRVVLVLRFYEDLTVGEIARTVDWPVGTVKSLLHRALNRLRKDLR